MSEVGEGIREEIREEGGVEKKTAKKKKHGSSARSSSGSSSASSGSSSPKRKRSSRKDSRKLMRILQHQQTAIDKLAQVVSHKTTTNVSAPVFTKRFLGVQHQLNSEVINTIDSAIAAGDEDDHYDLLLKAKEKLAVRNKDLLMGEKYDDFWKFKDKFEAEQEAIKGGEATGAIAAFFKFHRGKGEQGDKTASKDRPASRGKKEWKRPAEKEGDFGRLVSAVQAAVSRQTDRQAPASFVPGPVPVQTAYGYSGNQSQPLPQYRGSYQQQSRVGKCFKCGMFGHRQAECQSGTVPRVQTSDQFHQRLI